MQPSLEEIEQHRATWAEIAKRHGWYFEPFYIQIWHNKDGEIIDAVGHRGMQEHSKDLLILTN